MNQDDPRARLYAMLPPHQRPFECSEERAKELTPLHSTDLSQLAGGHLSHDMVAAKIRMLMRDSIEHEPICSMARDRIKWLAWRVEQLELALRTISEFPVPEQDNMPAHNMRQIAADAIGKHST